MRYSRRRALSEADYRSLADWRHALRRFLSASENITQAAGVSPTQYQLLLFVRGNPLGAPTIADLAERLQIRHQSAVGLVDRCVAAGLVRRRRDKRDRRRVFVTMTTRGTVLLRRLASEHYQTIESLGSSFLPPFRGARAGLLRRERRGRRPPTVMVPRRKPV